MCHTIACHAVPSANALCLAALPLLVLGVSACSNSVAADAGRQPGPRTQRTARAYNGAEVILAVDTSGSGRQGQVDLVTRRCSQAIALLHEKVAGTGGEKWMVSILEIGRRDTGGNPRVAVPRQPLYATPPLVETPDQQEARRAQAFDQLQAQCSRTLQPSDESPVWPLTRAAADQLRSTCPPASSQCRAVHLLLVSDLQEEGPHAHSLEPIDTQGVQVTVCGTAETVRATAPAGKSAGKRARKSAVQLDIAASWQTVLGASADVRPFCPQRVEAGASGGAVGVAVAKPDR